MIFQVTGWDHEITEWVGISATVFLTFWGFKVSAQRDMKKRHEENKKAQEDILNELKEERKYLPQHWHQEFRDGMTIDVPLTTDGIIRRPKNGT